MSRVPAWDLAVVLEGLSLAPFKHLQSAFKLTFLLAITSQMRLSNLQAL